MKRIFLFMIVVFSSHLVFSQTPGTLKWKYKTGDEIFGSPAIGNDGTIYVGSNDKNLYAINPDGTLKWKFNAGYGIKASPSIGTDGTIYIATVGIGKLFAVNPDGMKKWESARADGWIEDSPAITQEGTLVFATTNNNLYGVKSDGSAAWTITFGWNEYSSPAVGADGTIYIGKNGNRGFTARNSDGSEKWRVSGMGAVQSSPAIGSDGTIYVGSGDHYLHAINPDGTIKWSFKTGDKVLSSPVIGADGTIYLGSYDKKLYALNPDGTEKWNYETKGWFYYNDTPTVGADGLIYVTAYDTTFGFSKWLYAFNSDGKIEWVFTGGDAVEAAPAISKDGTIYIGSINGTLYAIKSGSAGLAESSWPRFRHDNQGTGRISSASAVQNTEPIAPKKFSVSKAYPNPFNPSTHVQFELEKPSHIRVSVYNATGRLVHVLQEGIQAAGRHELTWEAASFGSGIYFIRIQAGQQLVQRKCLLLK